MKKELLFYDYVQTKDYLLTLLKNYPYDIEASMVFSLCSKNPYPHPALLSFISYFESITKIHIITKKQEPTSSLLPLFLRMSALSQKDEGLLHSYHFHFQAIYLLGTHSFSHPYAHLPFHKIKFIDQIILHDKVTLFMSSYQEIPIQKSTSFIYRDISMDASDYLAIPIQITHKHGIIFLSKQCASLAIPLIAMFHMSAPCVHQDFLLIFGLADVHNSLQYYVDKTNDVYIGLGKGDEQLHHFLQLKRMILTLYNALCLHQDDLPIHGSMLQIFYHNKYYGLLFTGETTTGKSEMLDECIKICEQNQIPYAALFDDHGTLHYLDNEIVTTAIEISACKQLYTQSYQDIFASYHDGILLEGEDSTFYQITPLLPFKDTLQFHKVTHIFYLDNTKRDKNINLIENLKDALDLLQKGAYVDQNNLLKYHYFFNACGCVQEKDAIEDLLVEFITNFFMSNIPLYHIYTASTPYQKQVLYKNFVKDIFNTLLILE